MMVSGGVADFADTIARYKMITALDAVAILAAICAVSALVIRVLDDHK